MYIARALLLSAEVPGVLLLDLRFNAGPRLISSCGIPTRADLNLGLILALAFGNVFFLTRLSLRVERT